MGLSGLEQIYISVSFTEVRSIWSFYEWKRNKFNSKGNYGYFWLKKIFNSFSSSIIFLVKNFIKLTNKAESSSSKWYFVVKKPSLLTQTKKYTNWSYLVIAFSRHSMHSKTLLTTSDMNLNSSIFRSKSAMNFFSTACLHKAKNYWKKIYSFWYFTR